MTTKEVLIEARKLIEKKEDWFGGDNPCTNDNRKCAIYAMAEAAKTLEAYDRVGYAACNSFRTAIGTIGIATFNDTHTHAEVLEAFDKAIAAQP